MLRKHENSDSWKAGILAIGVHAVLLVAMLISFNWKAAHTVLNVTEVELWDKLPAPKVVETPKPVEAKPIIEDKPASEDKPKSVEVKPKPVEQKVDIELEKKKREQDIKEAQDKIKKEQEIEEEKQKELVEQKRKKLAQQMREEDLRENKTAENQNDEKLRKMQEEMLNENGADDAKASSAANDGLIAEYKAKIQAKIKANVNKTLCGDGSPEIRVDISVLPTGQISGSPNITKSSGNTACDEAVERAIIASEPLPLPDDPSLKAQFKNLKLKFRPND